jgi:hypothetical protein
MTVARPKHPLVPITKLKVTSIADKDYAEDNNGAEFVLSGGALDDADGFAGPEGSIIVSVPKLVDDGRGGQVTMGARYRLARRVALGTIAKLVATPAPRTAAKPYRRVDGLARFRSLDGRSEHIVGLSAHVGAIMRPGQEGRDWIKLGGTGPIRGRALHAWARKRFRLRVDERGQLEVWAKRGALAGEEWEILEAAAPLLAGFEIDDPLRCECPHHGDPPEAVTFDFPAMRAMCDEHREEAQPA